MKRFKEGMFIVGCATLGTILGFLIALVIAYALNGWN